MANKTVTVLEADGVTETDIVSLDVGRQAAAASKSLALSTEDKTVLDSLATKLDTCITALQIIDNMSFQLTTLGAGNVGATVPRVTLATDDAAIAALIASMTGGELTTSTHDAAASTELVQQALYAKAAAPTDVSADGDAVNAWALRNGAQVVNLSAAGALIPGDATNGLDVDVTRLPGVAGDVAHDAADSGNPQKVGGKAVNAEPAAVANNDRANFITDLVGKHIVLPYANPENFVSGAITSAMTGTTSTSLIAAPAAGLRNYITQITVSNSHATVGTDVIIQDGSGGTTLYTIPAAAVYGGAVITFPTPLRQPTTATAIYCANVTTGASTKVSASGYKGA